MKTLVTNVNFHSTTKRICDSSQILNDTFSSNLTHLVVTRITTFFYFSEIIFKKLSEMKLSEDYEKLVV